MAVHVKLHVFQKYWYLAHDPLFAVLKSELSSPSGTVLGSPSPEAQNGRQYWRGVPVAIAAGPSSRAFAWDIHDEEEEHRGHYAYHPSAVGDPWRADQNTQASQNSGQRERYRPHYSRGQEIPRPESASSERRTQPPPQPLLTPALGRHAVEEVVSNHDNYVQMGCDDRNRSREPRRRRRHTDDHSTHRHSSSSSRYHSSDRDVRDYRSPSRRPKPPQHPGPPRRPESPGRHASEYAEDSDRACRSRRPSFQRPSSHRTRRETDNPELDSLVYDTSRSSSVASTRRDSIFSAAPSASSGSSYVSIREPPAERATKPRRPPRSSSVERPMMEAQAARGGGRRSSRSGLRDRDTDKRYPPNSAMNKTKGRKKLKKAERSRSSSTSERERERGRDGRRGERRAWSGNSEMVY